MAHISLIADIDRRLAYVESQVLLGTDRDDVLEEQCKAMLAIFSTSNGITMEGVTAVSEHLAACCKFKPAQLASFSACLRLAASKCKQKMGARCMQSNPYLEYYLIESDWSALDAKGTTGKAMAEVVGTRMQSWGISCSDAETLKRGSAIIQHCMEGEATGKEKYNGPWTFKRPSRR